MTRYALYFSPPEDSAWSTAGNRWLGRDPVSDAVVPQCAIPGVSRLMLATLTADARRYGLHATLKAPFRLLAGFSEAHLLTMVQAFSAVQTPIVLQDIGVRPMGTFLALRPRGPLPVIGALAMRCVAYFDLLRDMPSAAETAKRRNAGLSLRQEALLQRWGYPYTEEEYCFHITLTDSLAGVDDDTVFAIRKAADACFAAAQASTPLVIDALSIFKEDAPGAPLTMWRRFPFQGKPTAAGQLL